MNKVKLSSVVIEDLKVNGFKSVIIFEASNPAELKDNVSARFLDSNELVPDERVTQNSFHVSIDAPVLIEICNNTTVFTEIPKQWAF